jgi:putative nucleotidyltransferase with HDIG domain
VLILAETLDLRDTGTALHSQTVGRYAEMIAAALGLGEEQVTRIRLAGLLHDIGKIGVPDPILRKPGPLDEVEWEEMKKHPELGARILAGANLDDISGWVLAHHERPDGRGYPVGLRGDRIPLEAKILSVADAFEAMTAERVYSPPLPVGAAIAELQRHAGTQFDAHIVNTFVACLAAEARNEPVAAAAG